MRLKYNILWFENDSDWIESIEEKVEDYLFDNAFILEKDIQENANNLNSLIYDIQNNLKNVDLILMDFNLLSNDKGDEIIKKIRENEIYTEILFYSQNEEVRKKFKEECIEGIYFSDRATFIQRLKQIIPHSINKVLDLTNMRGLVMAETSILDMKLNELLNCMLKYLDTKHICLRQDLIDKVFTKRLEHASQIKRIPYEEIKVKRQKQKRFLIEAADIPELLSDMSILFESIEASDRYQAVNKLGKVVCLHIDEVTVLLNDFKTYQEDIINKRNILAHVKEDTKDGKVVLRSTMKGYEEFIFSHEDFKIMRENLINHNSNIDHLHKTICQNL